MHVHYRTEEKKATCAAADAAVWLSYWTCPDSDCFTVDRDAADLRSVWEFSFEKCIDVVTDSCDRKYFS
jgi:hypothetical protein